MLNAATTARELLPNESEMESLTKPPSSGISEHSTICTHQAIKDWLMSSLVGSLASHSVQPPTESKQPKICGQKCEEQLSLFDQDTCSQKTSSESQSKRQQMICSLWVTLPKQYLCQRKTWVLTTFGSDFGYLHTPTTMANYCAPSMQKWNVCRNYKAVFGKPTHESDEYLMGWPEGWSALEPLETGKYLSWRQQHFQY